MKQDDDEVNLECEGESISDDKEIDDSPEANEFPYLNLLFAIVDGETLNLTSAGYFAKIAQNLLNKRPIQVMDSL